MSIFNSLTVYGGQWEETASEKLSAAEVNQVAKAKIVDSQYGKSICFILKTGQQRFMPLSNTCNLSVDEEVDLQSVKIKTLSREGNPDIYRATAESL